MVLVTWYLNSCAWAEPEITFTQFFNDFKLQRKLAEDFRSYTKHWLLKLHFCSDGWKLYDSTSHLVSRKMCALFPTWNGLETFFKKLSLLFSEVQQISDQEVSCHLFKYAHYFAIKKLWLWTSEKSSHIYPIVVHVVYLVYACGRGVLSIFTKLIRA